MIKVLVSGACGRMGQAVVKAVMEDSELQLVGAVDIVAGADAGELVGMGKSGVIVADDLAKAIDETKPEVMVDFTRPDVVYGNAVLAVKKGVSPVIGTTGLSDEAKAELEALAKEHNTPVFIAPNFAIGAVLMMLMA
ncbi:MAG: 4-hydroxy-tetrahydrodipicolinate reductase, partial [Selenomonadaceae bacterium]|nr:4-hydroxy-tetrahydrodipicolinate reductase [Selenomonadaceae bacterium]